MRKPLAMVAALSGAALVLPSCGSEDPDDGRLVETDQIAQSVPKCPGPGVNGQGDYCNGTCTCDQGEGDCDSSAQCTGNLVCGYDNGPQFGFNPGMDVCVPPHCRNGIQDGTETGVDCGDALNDCGNCVGCTGNPGDPDYCTQFCRCSQGQADCDTDDQCAAGLVCGQDIGALWGYSTTYDVCVLPHCVDGVQNFDESGTDCGGTDCGTCLSCPPNGRSNTCSTACVCPAGWGDCDIDAHCQTGLVCGADLGVQFGMKSTFDVCVPPHCTNGRQDSSDGETGVDCGGADCGTCDWGASPSTSCQAGMDRCGPFFSENCCASPRVPTGTYKRSFDNVGLTDGSNPATVKNVWLNRFEVTVRRFRQFVNAFDAWRGAGNPTAGAGTHPKIPGSGWDASWPLAPDAATLKTSLNCGSMSTWTDAAGSNEEKPINCVTWYDAFAFCVWDGGRLPTEAEWNNASHGGTEQRVYPWSSPPTDTTLNTSLAAYACLADGSAGCTINDIIDVGTKPGGDGRWTHADLAGNVWEWTLDWRDAYVNPCKNCAQLTQANAWKVMRGGSYQSTQTGDKLRAGWRQNGKPSDRLVNRGFRCARD